MTSGNTTAQAERLFWLSWCDHQRTRGLAALLEHQVQVWETRRSGALRYAVLSVKTVGWLLRRRPACVIVQCPSIVLALLVLCLRPLLRYRVFLDAHNEIVQNFNFPDSTLMARAYRIALRGADHVIVTNPTLAAQVDRLGGHSLVLPDAVIPRTAEVRLLPQRPVEVAVIATYANDEPIEQIIQAARLLGPGYRMRMTGRLTKRARELTESRPESLELTGFLSHEDYWALLQNSDIVLDLTLKPACLVCGAYEALSLRRPVVLSDDVENRRWFGSAAVYASNTAESIASAIQTLAVNYADFVAQQASAIQHIDRRWAELAGVVRLALQRVWQTEQGAISREAE